MEFSVLLSFHLAIYFVSNSIAYPFATFIARYTFFLEELFEKRSIFSLFRYISSSKNHFLKILKEASVLYFDAETRAITIAIVKIYTKYSAFCSSVKTDMGAAGAVSRLYIANANKKDSGNYSCALANVAAATMVSVHVLNGMLPL